jgi:type IV pilus biogenesis protein CpaD/CtpE
LIEVIDHLLAAPEPSEPVKLVQPHILYLFADPAMEAASAGHKIMMRMGSANEAKVKAKLRQIRRELIAASVSH